MKKFISLLLGLILIISTISCGVSNSADNASDTSSADNAESTSDNIEYTEPEIITFTDDCGRTVEIEGPITKFVASAPLGQIMLFALAPEMFAGISTVWDDTALVMLDEEYVNLPVIGQLYGGKGDVNLEELTLLAPQVLIDVGEGKEGVDTDLDTLQEQTGIPCIHIEANLYTMPDAYRKLGKLLGKETEAEEIASYYESWLNRTTELVTTIGAENLAKVVYCTGEDGLSVLAQGTYHAEILDILTNNIAVIDNPVSKGTGTPIDMEQLLLWDPDYIIFSPDGGYDNAAGNETWQELTAISNGNYIETPYGPYNWMTAPPSVQRILVLIWLPAVLYPEHIDYDVYEEVAKYFEMFYHCELTREQFDILTENAFIK